MTITEIEHQNENLLELSSLERLALEGALSRDKVFYPETGAFVGIDIKCALTHPQEVYKGALTIINDSPKVVERIGDYLITTGFSYGHDGIEHSERPQRISLGSKLLISLGKSSSEIAVKLVEKVKGKNDFDSLQRYVAFLSPALKLMGQLDYVYRPTTEQIITVITPEAIERVLRTISDTYEYKSLCKARSLLGSRLVRYKGKKKQWKDREYPFGSELCYKEGENTFEFPCFEDFHETIDDKYFLPIETSLEDFERFLGKSKFDESYLQSKRNSERLKEKVHEIYHEVIGDLTTLE